MSAIHIHTYYTAALPLPSNKWRNQCKAPRFCSPSYSSCPPRPPPADLGSSPPLAGSPPWQGAAAPSWSASGTRSSTWEPWWAAASLPPPVTSATVPSGPTPPPAPNPAPPTTTASPELSPIRTPVAVPPSPSAGVERFLRIRVPASQAKRELGLRALLVLYLAGRAIGALVL